MAKKIITQAERTRIFNEWLNTQPMPKFNTLIDRQRWWVGKCIEHDKLISEEYDIVAGFDDDKKD